jgi:hypothetical protein
MNKPQVWQAPFHVYGVGSEEAIERSIDLPTRGVTWVIVWAMAIAVHAIAIGILTEFGHCLSAERELARAARAASLEAILPRASYETIRNVVQRRLRDTVLTPKVSVLLAQNGAPVGRSFRPQPGDRIAVTLAVPRSEILPHWLQRLTSWRSRTCISVTSERAMPGKRLPMKVARLL